LNRTRTDYESRISQLNEKIKSLESSSPW
jgi:hypothetical protein